MSREISQNLKKTSFAMAKKNKLLKRGRPFLFGHSDEKV